MVAIGRVLNSVTLGMVRRRNIVPQFGALFAIERMAYDEEIALVRRYG